jgi:sulfotransferase famil protein
MLISEEKRFLFVHVQKTGGVTISRLLEEAVPDAANLIPRHMIARHAIERNLIPEDYFKFAFVRNPWERLVSWYAMIDRARKRVSWDEPSVRRRRFRKNPLYRYVYEHGPTFEDFVKNCTQPRMVNGVPYSFAFNQLDYLTDEKGELLMDFVGRFENFSEDLRLLFDRLGLPAPEVAHENRGRRRKRHYSRFYTPETKKIVAQRFERDIEYFGYEFEGGRS